MKIRVLTFTLLLLQAPAAFALEWVDLWFTPDQQAQQLMERGEFQQASEKFTQPMNIGTALFMAGEFESAAAVYGRVPSAQGHYNRGNAQVMLGNYDAAIEAYQTALSKRPNWPEAEENLQIASLRKEAMAPPDDDHGGTGGQLEADEYVFDLEGGKNKSSGEEVIDAADQQLGEDAMRAMWLRKVETRPADFLAARFNYQLAVRQNEESDNPEKAMEENHE